VTYSRERRPFARPIQPNPGVAGLAAISSERKRKATHGEKPLNCQLGVPYFFSDLLVDQYPRSHCAGHHQQFSRESDCRRILAFAFFIAYGVMSIPAGFLVERFTEKPVMVLAFLAGMPGSLSFALFPGYLVAIISYFTIGAGMAVLQVAINPLLRVAGGEEHYAFNSTVAQLVFGSAS
jgi:MFS family permease